MIEYKEKLPINEKEIIDLYKSVGWSRYTNEPKHLMQALKNSTYIICAYKNNRLIGLVRGLCDDISINYIQDILVLPEYQNKGIGKDLINRVLNKYPSVHKINQGTEVYGVFQEGFSLKEGEDKKDGK